MPEFFGDVIVVNGKSWPKLDVDARRYRFRLLNGANTRFFNLQFCAEVFDLVMPPQSACGFTFARGSNGPQLVVLRQDAPREQQSK